MASPTEPTPFLGKIMAFITDTNLVELLNYSFLVTVLTTDALFHDEQRHKNWLAWFQLPTKERLLSPKQEDLRTILTINRLNQLRGLK